MTLRAFHISPAIMKIITANIPRIIVGIVRWILKIVKLLLFLSSLSICHRGPAPVRSVGSQFGLRLRRTMEILFQLLATIVR